MTRKKSSIPSLELPEVNFSEDGEIRYLHLGTEWIQGSMFLDRPFDIELEYVQRMFGWLLFFPHAEVKGAHAMQLGLGAGTIRAWARAWGEQARRPDRRPCPG